MHTLLKICVSTDWKGRPEVNLEILGQSQSLDEIYAIQDLWIEQSKINDLKEDNELEREDAEDEGREPIPITKWENDERWEMDRPSTESLHTLCGKYDDGGTWSTNFKILTTNPTITLL